MFEQLEKPEDKKPTDYTGLKIVAFVAPAFLLFASFDKAELGLAVSIVLGMTVLAIKLRWRLRKYVWFWVTIVLISAAHFYLLFVIQLPPGWLAEIGRLHAVGLLPLGLADLLINLGAIGLAQKLFSSDSSPDDQG